MRKEDLEQYQFLLKEIHELKRKKNEIKNDMVMDTVKSSNAEFPYQEMTISISGAPSYDFRKKLDCVINHRLERADRMRMEIEEFISTIEDSRIRLIFEKRYIYGWSWQKISRFMGSADESYARKIHERYLEKHKK